MNADDMEDWLAETIISYGREKKSTRLGRMVRRIDHRTDEEKTQYEEFFNFPQQECFSSAHLCMAKIGAHVDGSIWLFFFNGINSGQGFPIECFEYVPLPKENEI